MDHLKRSPRDQTACAVARPALGIATKLKSAAKTKRTPPRAPGSVKTTSCFCQSPKKSMWINQDKTGEILWNMVIVDCLGGKWQLENKPARIELFLVNELWVSPVQNGSGYLYRSSVSATFFPSCLTWSCFGLMSLISEVFRNQSHNFICSFKVNDASNLSDGLHEEVWEGLNWPLGSFLDQCHTSVVSSPGWHLPGFTINEGMNGPVAKPVLVKD